MNTHPDKRVRVFSADELTLQDAQPGAKFWSVRLPRVMLTWFTVAPNVTFEVHSHESEQITYVVTGTLEFDVDGKVLPVRSGEAIQVPSHVPHVCGAWEKGSKRSMPGHLRRKHPGWKTRKLNPAGSNLAPSGTDDRRGGI